MGIEKLFPEKYRKHPFRNFYRALVRKDSISSNEKLSHSGYWTLNLLEELSSETWNTVKASMDTGLQLCFFAFAVIADMHVFNKQSSTDICLN